MRFRQVTESASDFVWETDGRGLYTYTSPSVETILGYTPEELVGSKHFYDLFTPERREEWKAAALAIIAARGAFSAFANANVSRSGAIVHLEMSGLPLLSTAGDLRGYRGAAIRVTARPHAEEPRRFLGGREEQPPRLPAERVDVGGRIHISDRLGMVGESTAIQDVLSQVMRVGPTASSVLITGETGTGKELIAHAVHRLSPRRERAMVAVNCAALPAGLVESELFGHEKGAYTGAVKQQVGRFEVADGSTLFLDEVGELTQGLQAKLLRVLDEGQFERLGSTQRRKADVRLVAATNRDLYEEVRSGRFRQDLYYRLNVFPIYVPPLRERPDDIPLLVRHFADYFGDRSGKIIEGVSRETMQRLRQQPWPGNVRELRNVVERAVVLASGRVLSVNVPPGPDRSSGGVEGETLTLEEVERRHILEVLTRTGGRISGSGGAAVLLGVNRTTLQSMIKRLGITRPGGG